MVACSDPGLNRHSANSAFTEPTPTRRPVSQVMEGFNPSPPTSQPSTRMTQSFTPPPQGGVDPVLGVPGGETSLGNSAQTLVPDGITSPDQGLASSVESLKTASEASLLTNDDFKEASSSRPDSGVEAMDVLAADLAEGLKLTECQNVKIDANRLSTNFAMFDPLLQDATDIEPIQRLRTASEPVNIVNVIPGQHRPGTTKVFFEQGARPKISLSQQHSAPRISVNDFGEGVLKEKSKPVGMSNGPTSIGVLVDLEGASEGVVIHNRTESDEKSSADSSSSPSFADSVTTMTYVKVRWAFIIMLCYAN